MLYFYCCDVMLGEKRIMQVDGSKLFNKKIETTAEFQEARRLIKQDIFEVLLQKGKILNTDEIDLHFNAFNPL